jgi:hypothetical protein
MVPNIYAQRFGMPQGGPVRPMVPGVGGLPIPATPVGGPAYPMAPGTMYSQAPMPNPGMGQPQHGPIVNAALMRLQGLRRY